MRAVFKERNPWIAGIFTLVFGPLVGLCYLGRGLLGIAYYALIIIILAVLAAIWWNGLLPRPMLAVSITIILYALVVVTHAVRLALRYNRLAPVKWYARGHSLVAIYLLPFLLAMFFRAYYFEPFFTTSASMSPSVNPSDYFFTEKYAYRAGHPARGDVITFRMPSGPGTVYVKRVVGIPGDRIRIAGGKLFINGTAVEWKKLDDFSRYDAHSQRLTLPQIEEILPQGRHYRILLAGTEGPLENTETYTVSPGHYFVLGDNRDDSRDSRDPTMSFIPEDAITGKAIFVLLNYRTQQPDYRSLE